MQVAAGPGYTRLGAWAGRCGRVGSFRITGSAAGIAPLIPACGGTCTAHPGQQAQQLTISATLLSFSNLGGLPSLSSHAAFTISRWLLQPRGREWWQVVAARGTGGWQVNAATQGDGRRWLGGWEEEPR